MNSKALTVREVTQVIREAASGVRPLRKAGSQWSEAAMVGVTTVDIDGWVITISREDEKLFRCDSCYSPDGRSYDFQSPLNQNTDPFVFLTAVEIEQLKSRLNVSR
ncbi:hypothetical protein D3C77_231360 [compost metagenome]